MNFSVLFDAGKASLMGC